MSVALGSAENECRLASTPPTTVICRWTGRDFVWKWLVLADQFCNAGTITCQYITESSTQSLHRLCKRVLLIIHYIICPKTTVGIEKVIPRGGLMALSKNPGHSSFFITNRSAMAQHGVNIELKNISKGLSCNWHLVIQRFLSLKLPFEKREKAQEHFLSDIHLHRVSKLCLKWDFSPSLWPLTHFSPFSPQALFPVLWF